MVLTNASFNFCEGAALLKGLGEWPAISPFLPQPGRIIARHSTRAGAGFFHG